MVETLLKASLKKLDDFVFLLFRFAKKANSDGGFYRFRAPGPERAIHGQIRADVLSEEGLVFPGSTNIFDEPVEKILYYCRFSGRLVCLPKIFFHQWGQAGNQIGSRHPGKEQRIIAVSVPFYTELGFQFPNKLKGFLDCFNFFFQDFSPDQIS